MITIRKEDGFTMVELIITMVVFVLIIAASSTVFTGLLTQFKQQSKISESNIEGIVGLEIMRQDLEHAGFGVPLNVPGGVSYTESSTNPFSLNDAASGVPRVIISQNDATFSAPNNIFDHSDYLTVKSTLVVPNNASQKWTPLSSASPYTTTWDPATENLAGGDYVTVIVPADKRIITDASNNFSTTLTNVMASPWLPLDNTETRIVYGINSASDPAPVRPFNRADYVIERPSVNMPSRCAPKTGVLYKKIMNHDTNGTFTLLPLLDCVADMQVVYGLDNDDDGDFVPGEGTPPDAYTDDISALTAEQIRNQVKEIRVYVLAHEGQKDPSYEYPNSTIDVPGYPDPAYGEGRTLDMLISIGNPDYKFYRWNVYKIIAKPMDLE